MAQYDQILLFYNQLLNMADDINRLIEKELFDEILDRIQTHDRLLVQIRLAKRCTKLTEDEEKEIKKLEDELKVKEKNNIELLQTNMDSVKSELNKLNMQNKIRKAYSQKSFEQEQGSIIDIADSYRPDKK